MEGYRAVHIAFLKIRHNTTLTDEELYLILYSLYKTAANGRRKRARRRHPQANRQLLLRIKRGKI